MQWNDEDGILHHGMPMVYFQPLKDIAQYCTVVYWEALAVITCLGVLTPTGMESVDLYDFYMTIKNMMKA